MVCLAQRNGPRLVNTVYYEHLVRLLEISECLHGDSKLTSHKLTYAEAVRC